MINQKNINKIFFIFVVVSFLNVLPVFSQTGGELFMENRCSRCHTIGRGSFVGPDLYDISKKYNKEQVNTWILNPEIVYSQANKKPYNPGYPPMPQLGISEHNAELITNFLFNNDIKRQKEDDGVIEGVLINESSGVGAEGNDIYLKSFIGDRLTGEKLQITDASGKFTFKGLSWVNSYSIKIKHKGLEYETAKMVFPPDKGSIDLKLPLFETTDNDSEIFLNLNHEILSVEEKTVSIAEIYDFENRGNKIYVGKQGDNNLRRTLKFYIPSNAVNLRFEEGLDNENIKREKNIVYDSSGFPPGRKRVVLTYDVPLEFGKNLIEKEIMSDVSTLLLLVDDEKGAVEVSSLNELEPVTIENKNYQRWSSNNLKSGYSYTIIITSRSLSLKYLDLFPIIIFAALFLSVFIIGLITRTENKKRDNTNELLLKRDKLLKSIIELDEEYNKNSISESVYKTNRLNLKNYIVEIDQKISSIKDQQNDTV